MSEPPVKKPTMMLTLGRVFVTIVFKIALPVAIIIGAVFYGKHMIENTQKAERKKRARLATLVSVTPAEKVTERVVIEAMGSVIPARELDLRPKVAGPIDEVVAKLEPGAFFKKGEHLLKIEARDFELQLTQRKQQVAIAASRVTEAKKRLAFAQRDIQIEKGRQEIARQDLEALGKKVDPENKNLVLRVPQLKAIRLDRK